MEPFPGSCILTFLTADRVEPPPHNTKQGGRNPLFATAGSVGRIGSSASSFLTFPDARARRRAHVGSRVRRSSHGPTTYPRARAFFSGPLLDHRQSTRWRTRARKISARGRSRAVARFVVSSGFTPRGAAAGCVKTIFKRLSSLPGKTRARVLKSLFYSSKQPSTLRG